MKYELSSQQLIEFDLKHHTNRPHIVVLGAGASLAAFPNGDATGQRLPLMANLIQVLGLEEDIKRAGYDPAENFEDLFSFLWEKNPSSPIVLLIQDRVANYFSQLRLPQHVTLYDQLILSLRDKDAIFTFNWDPFLADAYLRNASFRPPKVFFLHGNVRLGYCEGCGVAGLKKPVTYCCGKPLTPTPLLYPVRQKNYANNAYISSQWERAREYIKGAAILTIFGYSAPRTDQEALAIFRDSWKVDNPETRPFERVEIIDVRSGEETSQQWSSFAHFPDHLDPIRSFSESWLALYPRRTCEALTAVGGDGDCVESIPWGGNLDGLRASLDELITAEFGNL